MKNSNNSRKTSSSGVSPQSLVRRSHRVIWLSQRHLDRVLAIEQQTFDEPWSEHDLRTMLCNQQVLGLAVENDNMVAGYAICVMLGETIQVNRIAVHAAYRRSGIGTALVEHAKEMVRKRARRQATVAIVPLVKLDALAFFARCGFLARHGWVDGDGEDMINMEWVKSL